MSKDKFHNNTYEERLGEGVVRKDPRTDFLDTVGAAAWKRNIGPGVELRSGGGAAPYSYGAVISPTFAAARLGESSRTVGHFSVDVFSKDFRPSARTSCVDRSNSGSMSQGSLYVPSKRASRSAAASSRRVRAKVSDILEI